MIDYHEAIREMHKKITKGCIMRASDIQREIDRITQNKQQRAVQPAAWTGPGENSPIFHEETMQRHPELRQHYPVPLYYDYGPRE